MLSTVANRKMEKILTPISYYIIFCFILYREYALVGCVDGTSFVDVTDPQQPEVIGFLPTHSGSSLWRDIKVSIQLSSNHVTTTHTIYSILVYT